MINLFRYWKGNCRATNRIKCRSIALDITKVELQVVKKFIKVNLSNKNSIDQAMEQISSHIDSFFGVAGLSGDKTNYYKTFTVNYITNKYITEKYLKSRMSYGGTIAYVRST